MDRHPKTIAAITALSWCAFGGGMLAGGTEGLLSVSGIGVVVVGVFLAYRLLPDAEYIAVLHREIVALLQGELTEEAAIRQSPPVTADEKVRLR